MSTSPQQARRELAGSRRTGRISVEVETSATISIDDVLDQMTDEQLDDLMERRAQKGQGGTGLEEVYEEFRRRGDAPQVLKDYIYEHLGRILP
jgi:hypothetical protein